MATKTWAHRRLSRRLIPGRIIILGLLAGMLVACEAEAPAGPKIRAEDVWSRPAVAAGEVSGASSGEDAGMDPAKSGTGAVFMKLVNEGGEADRLVSAQMDAAEVVEIHETKMEGDVMRMQMLPNGLEIPAGGQVLLKPGSYHLMLIGLEHDLNEGDRISVLLRFEKSAPMTVEAEVRQP